MAKSGVNEKVQEARDRKAGAKKAAAAAAAKAKVSKSWLICATCSLFAWCLQLQDCVDRYLPVHLTLDSPPQDDAYWDTHANPKAKRDQKKEEQVWGWSPCGTGALAALERVVQLGACIMQRVSLSRLAMCLVFCRSASVRKRPRRRRRPSG